MLKALPKFSLVFLVLLFFGCSTVYKFGKAFDLSNISKIKTGTTTKQEILSYFGEPFKKGIANGDEVFYYADELIIFERDRTVKKEGNTLLIEFDSNGTVINYYLNVPGKETIILGYLFHKLEMEKKFQNTQLGI
ncbi:MAG: outer membrane protein assembly factor BamE [Bacteroidota bacterium]|jgi:outer membrane protein assembly factor BamE (lipoprotein component of BamABCDE complex)